MYIKETKKVIKEVDEIIREYDKCDKCDKIIETGYYELFECVLTIKEGESFPDYSQGTEQYMELCQNCSEELVKLLKYNNYRIIESDFDY